MIRSAVTYFLKLKFSLQNRWHDTSDPVTSAAYHDSGFHHCPLLYNEIKRSVIDLSIASIIHRSLSVYQFHLLT